MVATNAARKLFVFHLFLACAVSFQITKPGNVESINCQNIFVGIQDHENIFTWKFKTRRFYNMKISRSAVCAGHIIRGTHDVQSEVTYPNFSYPNVFSKATPTICGYFCWCKAGFSCLNDRYRVFQCSLYPSYSSWRRGVGFTGKVGFTTKVRATLSH